MRRRWLWALLAVVIAVAVSGTIVVLAWDGDSSAETTGTGFEEGSSEGTVVMPELIGMEQEEAVAAAEAAGFVVDSVSTESSEPRGTVVAQEPGVGRNVRPGSRHVQLDVSTGTEELEALVVPDLTGLQADEARARARSAGFTVFTVGDDGEVSSQTPAAGTEAPALTQITLTVGR